MMKASIVVVGGGVMGCAAAYFLARDHGTQVLVLERDPSYRSASSALSASSIRLQFSTPLNIALSQASLLLMRPWIDKLSFVEAGYLYLATPAGAAALEAQNALQRACGADVRLLDRAALGAKFPWLALDGIELGAWGARGEGWFDGPALHQSLRRGAQDLGVRFIHADAQAFDTHNGRVLAVRDREGQRHAADAVLLAAGAWSAPLAAALGIDLPVRARKRDVFVLDSPATLPGCPLLIDPSGVWLRPEGLTGPQGPSVRPPEGARPPPERPRGGLFIACAPPRDDDVDDAPLDAIDHAQFDEQLWPTLAARIPVFEALRVRSAWAGYYEMNTFDHNGLVGALPGFDNAFTACGFSGHGMQHALAVGRGIASFMTRGAWGEIDLTPLSVDRVQRNAPLHEANVI
jgi:FAD-dependent oxidoreductase domain-containing protein 1